MTHLHEDNNGDDGIADGEDAPEHPNGLAVAHELVGVVVRRLPVLQLRLHTDPKTSLPSTLSNLEVCLCVLKSEKIYVFTFFQD